MKICRFGENHLGLVEGDQVRDVTAALELLPAYRYPLPKGDPLINHWDAVIARVVELAANAAVLLKGHSIMGVVQGDTVPEVHIPLMVDLHMSGLFPFDRMIAKYKLNQINEAIEDQKSGKVVKDVFTFD